MFGKKKTKEKKKAEDKEPSIHIETIPELFYGGKDPLLYRPSSEVSEEQKKPGKSVRRAKKAAPGREPGKAGVFWKSKAFLITSGSILLVAIVGGISWYYIRQLSPAIVPAPPTAPAIEIPVAEPEEAAEPLEVLAPTPTEEIGIEAPEEEPTPVSLAAQPLDFPPTILVDSVDLDADELTDMEEELFDTDSGIWDSDGDGYYDGQEVVNLYNPNGEAPVRLIDSGLIREYVNPTFQYRLYYPIAWEIGAVDPDARQVLLSGITGDFIEIRAIEKQPDESFEQWFARNAVGQKFLDLRALTNRFQEEGQKRKDNLVAYFVEETVVYVMLYHPGTTGTIPYRHVMAMAIQSFRPSKTLVEIPEQVTLPPPPIIEQEVEVVTNTVATPT